MKRGQKLEVIVERLSVGGRGVARFEKLVIFVPDTAPQETVEVELTFVKKNYAEARLLRVVHPSPFRRQPPCPVAGVCGGCNWQHVTYLEQLAQKRDLVRESIRRFAGVAIDDDFVLPVIPSPNELRYRNRVQIHHAASQFGFNRRASHSIVDIDDCPITETVITKEFPRLKEKYRNEKAGRVELFVSADGSFNERTAGAVVSDDDSTQDLAPFSQVNTTQNRALIEAVLQHSSSAIEPRTIWDLYAGNGNFTFPLAQKFANATIVSVEMNGTNVHIAQNRVAAEFAHRDFRVLQDDVAQFLRNEKAGKNSLVLLDPPRVGCAPEVIDALANSDAQRILYVSCHPVTLARDLKPLIRAGYELTLVQPFDMFPQTDHVETLVVLTLVRPMDLGLS